MRTPGSGPLRIRARGVSLIFAMLALAAISLAAVAIVRSGFGSSLVIGNIGFKQDTTRAADRAAEVARKWLVENTALATNGASGTGYYATANADIDPTGQRTSASKKMAVIDWAGSNHGSCVGSTCSEKLTPSNEFELTTASAPGYKVRAQYLITRLCPNEGIADSSNACAQPTTASMETCADNGVSGYPGTLCTPAQSAPFYRIIVRTVGGRNTISYIETIVY